MTRSPTRGESGNGGESSDSRRGWLAARLEAAGHGDCAYDLEAADVADLVAVGWSIVEHLEEGCGAPRERDQPIARDLRRWLDELELDRA